LQLTICPIEEILVTPRERCESLTFNKRKTTLEGISFLQLDILCVKWIADSFLAVNSILGSQKHSDDSEEKQNDQWNECLKYK